MKIVGMMPVFNEEDIISESINHLLNQGIEPLVLDNGSSDGTIEICKRFAGDGKIKLFQYESEKFDLILTLRKLYDLAILESPDWVLLTAADEFPESGLNNITLKDAILNVDSEGYNLIQFNLFDFFMTDKDQPNSKIVKKLLHYSLQGDWAYRAWKFFPGINVLHGHHPIFPNDLSYKIHPRKFVLRHYPFRDKEQAQKRIESRIQRNSDTMETKIGWHSHYLEIQKQDYSGTINHDLLTKYDEDNKWNLEIKFSFRSKTLPKREDLFSGDGTLKQSLGLAELLLLKKQQQKLIQNLRKNLENHSVKEGVSSEKNDQIEELKKIITEQDEKIQSLENTIESIQNSFTWKTLTKIDKSRKKIFHTQ